MRDWFEEELKKLPGGLHLRMHSKRSKAVGLHPHTLQVWAIGEVSKQPYLVMYLVDENGNPRRPCAADISKLKSLDKTRQPGFSQKGYVRRQLAAIDGAADSQEEKAWENAREWFRYSCVDEWRSKKKLRSVIPVKRQAQ